jgi:predicted Fe-S protein YdhL (DUF1289 family)
MRLARSRAVVEGQQGLPAVISPCIKVCQMDPQRGVCLGCCRTLDEIARWGSMEDSEKILVMEDLPARKKRLNVPEIAVPPLA